MNVLVRTTANWSGLVLRLTLALVVFPHGAQKLLGWFGGGGFTHTMAYFTDIAQLPYLIGLLTIIFEFFGPLLLIAGLATRFCATSALVVFLGAIAVEHHKNGFFMNWFNNQPGEGMEYSLLILGISLTLLLTGGGRFSMDYQLTKQRL